MRRTRIIGDIANWLGVRIPPPAASNLSKRFPSALFKFHFCRISKNKRSL